MSKKLSSAVLLVSEPLIYLSGLPVFTKEGKRILTAACLTPSSVLNGGEGDRNGEGVDGDGRWGEGGGGGGGMVW